MCFSPSFISFFCCPITVFSKIAYRCFILSSSFCSFGGGRLSSSFPLVFFGLSKGIGDFFAAVGGADEDEECAADDDEAKGPG